MWASMGVVSQGLCVRADPDAVFEDLLELFLRRVFDTAVAVRLEVTLIDAFR